jgi:hypothetical protein
VPNREPVSKDAGSLHLWAAGFVRGFVRSDDCESAVASQGRGFVRSDDRATTLADETNAIKT